MAKVSGIAGLLAALVAVVLVVGPVQAKVTRLEITSKQPYGSFQGGEYVRWEGRVVGELAPVAGVIPGLEVAGRNAAGMVEYSARVILFMPAGEGGNGALLVDVPNRGRAYAQALYNSPRGLPMQSGNTDPGTGFLEDQGFSIAEVYWELGQGAELPSFRDAEGKTRFVEGVGFAVVRDTADFLAHAAVDGVGVANPLAGKIGRVLASGKSQDGRFLKTFLLHGFNYVDGRRVFDGMHVFVSGAGLLPILATGLGPGSSADKAPSFAEPEFPGVHDGPLTIGEVVAAAVARGEVPPRMMLVNSTVDYLSLRASLGRTGARGTADLALPETVRMYDVAGASHVTVASAPDCRLAPGRLDWAPVARATLLRLDRWVGGNVPPPPTTLMPLEPSTDETVLQAPRALPEAVVQVPRRDADGNAVGGVRLPDIAVPLGVHGVQNEPSSFSCSLVGAYLPFGRTEGEATDGRASLVERYGSEAGYQNRVRVAARASVASGFLLPMDAAVIVDAAVGAPVMGAVAPARQPR